ncbi:MAG: RAMP superfamily CRISPR-associated protein, partial [Saprospiraceae bacterium]
MPIIKAPYNFVPLNEKVVYPHWAEVVSQDIPFEDGISGEIDVTLTAHSPIFIRNGGQKAGTDLSFSQDGNGNYFIPGSTMKGMVSNLVEIMSFGKMRDRVNNHRYAVRDLKLDSYMNQFQLDKNIIYCGWLQKDKKTNLYKI